MTMNANAQTNSPSGAPSTRQVEQVTIQQIMPLEQAEAVVWQGRGPREPMGQLLAKRTIDLGDLAWALEHAYRPEVRMAARTLLAHNLGKSELIETTHRFGPRVFGTDSYLEEKQYDSLFEAFYFAMSGLLVGLAVLLWLGWGIVQVLLKGAPWP